MMILIHLFQVIADNQSTTSYAGHAFGGLAGVLVGTILLENRKVKHNRKLELQSNEAFFIIGIKQF